MQNHSATPDGLVRFWCRHAGNDVGDLCDKIRVDVRFREKVAECAVIGFELPSIAPNVPNFTPSPKKEVLA